MRQCGVVGLKGDITNLTVRYSIRSAICGTIACNPCAARQDVPTLTRPTGTLAYAQTVDIGRTMDRPMSSWRIEYHAWRQYCETCVNSSQYMELGELHIDEDKATSLSQLCAHMFRCTETISDYNGNPAHMHSHRPASTLSKTSLAAGET